MLPPVAIVAGVDFIGTVPVNSNPWAFSYPKATPYVGRVAPGQYHGIVCGAAALVAPPLVFLVGAYGRLA